MLLMMMMMIGLNKNSIIPKHTQTVNGAGDVCVSVCGETEKRPQGHGVWHVSVFTELLTLSLLPYASL